MGLQPGLQGRRLPVGQQVDRRPGAHVRQDGPVDLALAQREIIDPGHLRCRGHPRDRARRRPGAAASPGAPRSPAGRPAGNRPGQPAPGRYRPAAPAAAGNGPQALHLLGERNRRTPRGAAQQPPHGQADHHRPPAAPSARRRAYRLCTRTGQEPHDGRAAPDAPGRAKITTSCAVPPAPSTSRARRCGNSSCSTRPQDGMAHRCGNEVPGRAKSWQTPRLTGASLPVSGDTPRTSQS
jgi:hypothetical protein